MEWFADVPDSQSYDVLTFGADYIDLKDQDKGSEYHLVRVEEFSLGNEKDTIQVILKIINFDESLNGKIVFGQLFPMDGLGIGYISLSEINSNQAYIEYNIVKASLNSDPSNIGLLLGVVEEPSKLTIDAQRGVVDYNDIDIIAMNINNIIEIEIDKSQDTISVANLDFINGIN